MADEIRPTPRSPILGLFSDLVNLPLQYMSAPQRTQQMQGVAEFIRGTGVPSTLERLSYGQGLFTGAGGLGGTTRLRPEVAEAALTVAPMVGPGAKLAGRAVRATEGLPVGASIQDVSNLAIARGTNPVQGAAVLIGDRIFLGRTHGDALNRAVYEGVVRKEGGKYIYPKGAEVDMDLFMLNDGRIVDRLTAYKQLDVGSAETAIEKGLMQNTPGRSMTVDEYMKQAKALKQERERTPSYPQEEALRLAQQRAALPVSEGGLGLPPNNTPMDRARAMGFGTESFHGTKADVQLFDKSKNVTAKDIYSSPNPVEAGAYAEGVGGNVMPLLLRGDVKDLTTDSKYVENQLRKAYNAQFSKYERQYYPFEQFAESFMRGQLYQDTGGQSAQNALVSELIGNKKSILKIPDAVSGGGIGESYVVADPSRIRSRFAAFDPTRRNEPDLLAGALPFTVLIDEENRRAMDEFLSNPIMYRDPFGSTAR